MMDPEPWFWHTLDTVVEAVKYVYAEIPAIFYSFVAAVISAVMASKIIAGNNRRDRTFIMIQEYFSGRMHLARRRSDRFIRTKFSDIKINPISWTTIKENVEKSDQDERDFYYLMQYFERLNVLIKARAIDSSLVWLSLGRHIIYWNDEVFSNILPDEVSIDPRQGRIIAVCRELSMFIADREARLSVRIGWEARHPWLPVPRRSVWQQVREFFQRFRKANGRR